jgi:hypothetical protein
MFFKVNMTHVQVGARSVPELEPEPYFEFTAPRSRSRNKYLLFRNTAFKKKYVQVCTVIHDDLEHFEEKLAQLNRFSN